MGQKKDLSTVLICSACKGTFFEEKNHEGSILLHCANCGGSAKVAKAGIGFAIVASLEESGRVFPTAKETVKKPKGGTETVEFEIMEFRLPAAVKRIVQAALWAAKCTAGVTGSWYGGAMLGNICTDFLSGLSFDGLAPADLQRITKLLEEAAEEVKEKKEEAFQDWPAGFQEHAKGMVHRVEEGPLSKLPQVVDAALQVKEEEKAEAVKDRVGKAVVARKAKSFQRLEACVRGIDFQIREVQASTVPTDAHDLDYLNDALEKGANFLRDVKAGVCTLSDPPVQRYMKQVEERLGTRPKKDEGDDD